MKALTVIPLKAGSAELSDVDEPPEADGPVLVETLAIGICGTDVEILSGDYGWPPPGRDRLVLGHESIGRVLEAPDGAPVQKGDLVVGIVRRPDPVPCANCAVLEWDFCRNGQYTERGIKEHDGYLSERYRITPDFVVKVNPALGILGVLLEPTSVVAKAWEEVDRVGGRAHWDPKTVLVTGAGPIGLLAALIGVQRGLEVHVLDQMSTGVKPDLVRDLGATYHTGTVADALPGPDVVIECTGVASLVLDAMTPRRHRRGRLPHRRVVGRPHRLCRRGRPQPQHGARERGRGGLRQCQPAPLRGRGRRPGHGRPGLVGPPGEPAGPAGAVAGGGAARTGRRQGHHHGQPRMSAA